jgi:hypothetical protein
MRTFTTTRRSLISAHNNCGCTVQPFGQIRDNGPGISLSPTASFKVSLIANWHQNRLEILGSAHSKPNDKCFDSFSEVHLNLEMKCAWAPARHWPKWFNHNRVEICFSWTPQVRNLPKQDFCSLLRTPSFKRSLRVTDGFVGGSSNWS